MSGKRKADKSSSSNKKSFNDRLLEDENSPDLSELLKQKWKVFRVSNLYNFEKNKLKAYSNKLNEELNSRKKFLSSPKFKSNISLNKNLRYDDQGPECLQVQVLAGESQVYLAHFVSWTTGEQISEECISLPILLVESRGPDLHKIHASLCKIFDCDIQSVSFSFNALVSFLVKLLDTPKPSIEMSQAILILEFKIPGCDASDNIKLFLPLEDVVVVFAVVEQNLNERIAEGLTNLQIIWEFYTRLLTHVYTVYKMDLMYAELHKITFPDAELAANGQLKMLTMEAAISCLNILQCFTPLNVATRV